MERLRELLRHLVFGSPPGMKPVHWVQPWGLRLRVSLLSLLFLLGTACGQHLISSDVHLDLWHDDDVYMQTVVGFEQGAYLWYEEINLRYPDEHVIIVDGHGGTGPDGDWWFYPDLGRPIPMRELVANIRRNDPWSRIVILACNPDAIRLDGLPRITYALDSTWVMPDRYVSYLENIRRDFYVDDYVGTIAEFVESE